MKLPCRLLARGLLPVLVLGVLVLGVLGLGMATPSAFAAQLRLRDDAAAGAGLPADGIAVAPDDASCADAVARAERRYATPIGLLAAIATVESGRHDPRTGVVAPWPWTINAEGRSLYFASRADAIAWVEQARARGVVSMDVGCMQVNLAYHARAFATLEDAFDPVRNADYAARFLVQLCTGSGSWMRAVGFYHSQTPALAIDYRRQVGLAFAHSVVTARISILQRLQAAWAATLPHADADASTGGWIRAPRAPTAWPDPAPATNAEASLARPCGTPGGSLLASEVARG